MQKNPYSSLCSSLFSFFELRENPFTVSPDPRYLFVTRKVQKTLDLLADGIEERRGMTVLTGEVGTGKTTVINRLLKWLGERHMPTALIVSSLPEPSHLFDFMLAGFAIPFDSGSKGDALMNLNRWLLERHGAGEIPVLIVDEAQGLPINVLEELRMLLSLETQHVKLLQVVLAGQPELEEKLRRPELNPLKQQIALRCTTETLTLQETHDYIRARLRVAGGGGKPIFGFQAMNAVYLYSRGIPRVVNLLCEHALINAYAGDALVVSAPIVEEIAREFQFDKGPLALLTSFESTFTTNERSGSPAAPLAASRPNILPSPEVGSIYKVAEGLRHLGMRILGESPSRPMGIGHSLGVRFSSLRPFFSFLFLTFAHLRSDLRNVVHAWQRMRTHLVRWLKEPLVQRNPLAGLQNPTTAMVWSAVVISRQLHRWWHRWRNQYLPAVRRATQHRVRTIGLRWLQYLNGPFRLRRPSPKGTSQHSRISSAL